MTEDELLERLHKFSSDLTKLGSAQPLSNRQGIENKYSETYRDLQRFFGYPKLRTRMR